MARPVKYNEFRQERLALGIRPGTYYGRLNRGWSKEVAATTPVRQRTNYSNLRIDTRSACRAFGRRVRVGDAQIWRCEAFGFDLHKIAPDSYKVMYHATRTWGRRIKARDERRAVIEAVRAAVWHTEHVQMRIKKHKEAKHGNSTEAA